MSERPGWRKCCDSRAPGAHTDLCPNQGLQVIEGEQIPQQPRRAYRYRVTGSEGAGIAAVADAKHMLEWEFRGLQYSWTIFNFQTGQPVGQVHGEFLDKGWLLNGVYEPEEAA